MILFDKQLNVFHLSNDQISYLLQIEEGAMWRTFILEKKSPIILVAIATHALIGPFHLIPQTVAIGFSH